MPVTMTQEKRLLKHLIYWTGPGMHASSVCEVPIVKRARIGTATRSSATSGETAKSPSPSMGKGVWLVTADERMRQDICGLLQTLECEIVAIDPARSNTENPWEWSEASPNIIMLDIGEDMDWGGRIIDAIHHGGRNIPLVVLTRNFSREFGAKIIPRGMCYYFPRDFCPHEFLEVIRNLVERQASPGVS